MDDKFKKCSEWYSNSYANDGFRAQRLYPNEELLRFLGREYFCKTVRHERKGLKVLELGCGSCSNLWMVAREGFDAYGIDISRAAIELGLLMLENWEVEAELNIGTMTNLPYQNDSFDIVYEIISAHCLSISDFHDCLDEVKRVLKKGGKFFSYHISTNSDAFKNYHPSKKIDEYTLDGIKRETSPFYGNEYPCRFISPEHFRDLLEEKGFAVSYLETVSRTYRDMQEYFEFVVIVGEKK